MVQSGEVIKNSSSRNVPGIHGKPRRSADGGPGETKAVPGRDNFLGCRPEALPHFRRMLWND